MQPEDHAQIENIYRTLQGACHEIATYLRYHSAHQVESINTFGKQQSSIDLKADAIISEHLKSSGLVYGYVSEEKAKL
jgi:fructose-1,6-bisphosphatase